MPQSSGTPTPSAPATTEPPTPVEPQPSEPPSPPSASPAARFRGEAMAAPYGPAVLRTPEVSPQVRPV
ncbi:hypothetical protein [Streptomyces sp. NPDC059604]|uniref:hypothetical protein n=1 Tax=Streptomyces sp. NPDC059604 TaxID=3346881 RepID=UPI0036A058A8